MLLFEAHGLKRYFAGALADGGSDTTSAFLRSVSLILIAFPDAQRKLSQEVDSVVGNRLPKLSDGDNLPYLNAFISEVSSILGLCECC